METIIRYANGTLYSAQIKKFITYSGIVRRNPGEFHVVDKLTKKDVTDEVTFLAEVEHVKKTKSYSKVRITYIGE
jgi:polyhydroxyalkanoate synthesis regulator protein